MFLTKLVASKIIHESEWRVQPGWGKGREERSVHTNGNTVVEDYQCGVEIVLAVGGDGTVAVLSERNDDAPAPIGRRCNYLQEMERARSRGSSGWFTQR